MSRVENNALPLGVCHEETMKEKICSQGFRISEGELK
jgi:hypothetical protein